MERHGSGTSWTGGETWQRQVRLLMGLIRIAEGQSVTAVAMEVGYESPSAFISMFRRALGTTPNQYFLQTRRARET